MQLEGAMNRENLMATRQGLLQVVEALEQEMALVITTAKIRKWFKHFGPAAEKAQEELAALEEARQKPRPWQP